MKSELSLIAAIGLTALVMRIAGSAPLADLTAIAYLTVATLTLGRSLGHPDDESRRRASAVTPRNINS